MNGDDVKLIRNDLAHIEEAVTKLDRGWVSTLAAVRANQLEIAKQQEHTRQHCDSLERVDKRMEYRKEEIAEVRVEIAEVRKDVRKVELTVAKVAAALGGSAFIGGLSSALVQALTQ